MTDYYSGLFASTIDQQFLLFVKALLLGFAIAALYDVLRIYRTIVKCHKTVLTVQDIIYSVIAALLTFLFALVLNSGKVRVYLILSHFFGAILYRLSLSKIVMAISTVVIRLFKNISKFIHKKLIKPVVSFFSKKATQVKNKLKLFFKNLFFKFKLKKQTNKKQKMKKSKSKNKKT